MMKKYMSLVALTMFLSACATPPDGPTALSLCQAERNACKTERRSCVDSLERLTKSLAERDKTQSDLNRELSRTKQNLAECLAEATKVSREASSLSIAKAELERRLHESIQQKDVQIELLNDILSVRVLDRILFDSGSVTIRAAGIAVLNQVAQVLVDSDEYIRVEGHTDNVPISALLQQRYPSNWELSGARAASVVRLFQDVHQIEPVRMEAVGHAFYAPVGSNDTEETRQQNRRVEIVLTTKSR